MEQATTQKTLQEVAKEFYQKYDQHAFKYDAFISYRHLEPDAQIAKAVQHMIETYKPPHEFKRNGKLPSFRVFRDREELATASLNDSLDQALKSSRFLIVICSKQLPLSQWCNTEVETFLKLRGPEYIIPILIEGETSESFPFALRNLRKETLDAEGNTVQMNFEHLAADLRPKEVLSMDFPGYAKMSATSQKVRDLAKESIKLLQSTEKYRIMAGMFNCSMGDLKNREKERRQKRLITLITIVATSLAIFGIFMFQAYQRENIARKEAINSNAKIMLNQARQILNHGDRVKAALIAEQAVAPIDDSFEEYQNLKQEETAVYSEALFNLASNVKTVIHTDNNLSFPKVHPDGELVISGLGSNQTGIWNIANGELVFKVNNHEGIVKSAEFSHQGDLFLTAGMDNRLNIWSMDQKEVIASRDFPASILMAQFSKDDQVIYILYSEEYQMKLATVDVDSGEDMYPTVTVDPKISGIDFVPDKHQALLIIDGSPEESLQLLDIETQEIIKTYPPIQRNLNALSSLPINDDHSQTVDSQEETTQEEKENVPFEYARVGNDGDTFIAMANYHYYLFELDGDRPLIEYDAESFTGAGNTLWPIDLSEENRIYIPDGYEMNIFQRDNGKLIATLDNGSPIQQFTVNPDQTVVTVSSNGDLGIAKDDKMIASGIPANLMNIEYMYATQTNQYALALSRINKKISIIDVTGSERIQPIKGAIKALSPSSRYSLFETSYDHDYQVWNNQTESPTISFNLKDYLSKDSTYYNERIALSDDGEKILLTIEEKNEEDSQNFLVVIHLRDHKVIQKILLDNIIDLYFDFMKDSDTFFVDQQSYSVIYAGTENSGQDPIFQHPNPKDHAFTYDFVTGPNHTVAFNYYDGMTSIYDLKNQQELGRLTGQVIHLSEVDGHIRAIGISNNQGFTWQDNQEAIYHDIDPAWSQITTLSNDIHHYNPTTDTLVTMRNQPVDDDIRHGFIVDFSTGKIIQHLTSDNNYFDSSKIYISPDGNTVYYDANLFEVEEDQEIDPNNDPLNSSYYKSIIKYQLSDPENLRDTIQNYIQGRALNSTEREELGLTR